MRRLAVLIVMSCWCVSASAQREFVEEVERPRPPPADVDLDAPDPATVPPPSPTPSPQPPPPPPAVVAPGKAPTPVVPEKLVKDETAVPPVAVQDPPAPGAVFTINEGGRDAFLEKVKPHFAAVLRGEVSRARKALSEVERGGVEAAVHGVPGGFAAPAVGQALVREARRANDDGRSDEAVELLMTATKMAPSDLTTALGIMRVHFDSLGPVAALGDVESVARALMADPVDQGNLVARAAAVGLLTVLGLLLLASLVMGLPALPVTVFDIVTRLPRGVHVVQGWLLVVTLVAAPFLLGLGAVPSLLWVCALTAASMPRRSRVLVGIIGATVVTTPLLVGVLARAWTAPSSTGALVHRALFDVDGADAVAGLKAAQDGGANLDLLARVAIANAARREGRIDEALRAYRELVQRHGDVSFVHGGYGVVLANAGELDLALAEFGLAIERAAGEADGRGVSEPAAFNASMIHHAAGRTEKAQALLGPLAESNPAGLALMRRATFRAVDETVQHNRAFVEVLPPRSSTQALLGGPAADALEAGIGGILWHGLPKTSAMGLLAGVLALFIAVSAISTRVDMATPCHRCGAPSSRRVDGPDVPHETCAACFHAFVSTKSRVEAAVRIRKENAIRRRGIRRGRAIVFLSIWPGAGHLFAGAGARGGVLAVLGTFSALAALASSDAWPGPRISDLSGWLLAAPLGLAFCVILAVAVRSALGVATEERGGFR
jgi:tetratricopeptide (TPR) repeat protein